MLSGSHSEKADGSSTLPHSSLLFPHIIVWGSYFWGCSRAEPRGSFLLAGAALQTLEPRGSFLLAGAALQALDGARARFGAPLLDAARRSTLEPRGSFLLAGAALQALDGARAHFGASRLVSAGRGSTSGSGRCPSAFRGPSMLPGAALSSFFRASRLVSAGRGSTSGSGRCPPPSMLPGAALSAALWSLAARFCWQGQHFRLWTVPERVSGPPPLMLPGAALSSLAGASRLVSAGRGSTSGSGRCPSAFRGPPPLDAARRSTLEPRGSFLLAGAALQALDGARARFGAPPLDAARRSTFEPRGSFLLAGSGRCPSAFRGPPPRCCQAQHFGASRLVSAGRGSTSGSHTHTLDTGNAQSSDLNYSQLSSYVSRRDLRMKNKM